MSEVAGVGGTAAPVGRHSESPPIGIGVSGPEVVDASGIKLQLLEGTPLLPAMTPGRSLQLAAKRIFDLAFALVALVTLAPLLLALAVLIRATSPGPALLRQARSGKNGKPFLVWKFRTMFIDRGDPTGVSSTVIDDPRVTPLGHIIRRSNLDELPQLFNVVRGEMSLVGPRPHPIGMIAGGMTYDELVGYYSARLAMQPGITGWAQANGLRGPATNPDLARRRIEHDLAYIQNFTLWLDMRALWRTAIREFGGGSGT